MPAGGLGIVLYVLLAIILIVILVKVLEGLL